MTKSQNKTQKWSLLKTQYLNDHPKVIDAFEIRVREIMEGSDAPQTLMSSFKKRLAAGEVDIHHHHAEYSEPEEHKHSHDHGHDHSHGHSHDHSHGHSHGVYKHIAHPMGPRTMIGEGVCCCFMSQFPQEVLDEEKDRIGTGHADETLAHR